MRHAGESSLLSPVRLPIPPSGPISPPRFIVARPLAAANCTPGACSESWSGHALFRARETAGNHLVTPAPSASRRRPAKWLLPALAGALSSCATLLTYLHLGPTYGQDSDHISDRGRLATEHTKDTEGARRQRLFRAKSASLCPRCARRPKACKNAQVKNWCCGLVFFLPPARNGRDVPPAILEPGVSRG